VYPGHWSTLTPDKAAVVAASSGEVVTYRELDDRSNQLAQLLRSRGLRPDDHVGVMLRNHVRYFEVAWAALRSGLYLTTVNSHLTAEEAAYILDDCGADAVVTSADFGHVAAELHDRLSPAVHCMSIDGVVDGWEPYEDAIESMPATPLAEEPLGEFMLYSSGTTGRPKGISRPLSGDLVTRGLGLTRLLRRLFGFDESSVYLSPAPLYHSSPLAFTTATQSLGGTVVMLESFDPAAALAAIEEHRVTHSQWVPTMFSRMLKLPEAVRHKYDLSSHRVAIHAAAPCPRAVKEAMFEWWGPILHEYYAGTELNGLTYASPSDWMAHPGTVGKAMLGTVHICDDEGVELPVGEEGMVFFELANRSFEYHGDPQQTEQARNRHNAAWTTLGDVGRLDEDGFLYLTDRASFMIVSGGVNIYPREIEDCLVMHPDVEDVAAFGVPNDDMGEEVKAVVQLAPGTPADADTEQRLIAYAREHLSHYKCPRSIDFIEQLPRLESGKLYKRVLREPYWAGRATRIV
jgi:long-chain acyl-CoA synthetase